MRELIIQGSLVRSSAGKFFKKIFLQKSSFLLSNCNIHTPFEIKNSPQRSILVKKCKSELNELGIIFCSFSEAVKNYPDLVKKYLGTVIPVNDNYFSTLKILCQNMCDGFLLEAFFCHSNNFLLKPCFGYNFN